MTTIRTITTHSHFAAKDCSLLAPGSYALYEAALYATKRVRWSAEGTVLVADTDPEPDAQREPLATVPEPSPFVRAAGLVATLIALPLFVLGLLIGGAIRLARRK